ncbi:MAG: lipopolysaccharide heptosyltransferase II [Candidatus Omnitrophota bacterium]
MTNYNRILIIRTDKIGDVVLSTPVITALRSNYPESFIAIMVAPEAREIVEGNPYLDEVIVFDKNRTHKGFFGTFRITREIKNRHFDLAVILHTTNRINLITFFAGIKKRIGYDRRLSFLLTDKLKDTKYLGKKHEVEYNLDIIKKLGIEFSSPKPFIPLKDDSEKYIEDILRKNGITEKDKIVVLHPGASCVSKRWPFERFSELADILARDFLVKIIIVASKDQKNLADLTLVNMKEKAINLAGIVSISQLASLLRRASLFISNDSGPVHIASALDTPVISIFGRKQAGLSPKRWRPFGAQDKFLHKDAGCIECHAHNCVKNFICLKTITVNDVIDMAKSILNSR